jgi:hypothetical protein
MVHVAASNQPEPLLAVPAVEDAQLHTLSDGGKHGEVNPGVGNRRPQRFG